MISKDIENRIIKYFTQSADTEDLDILNNWLLDVKNQKIFKSYVKIHFAINLTMNNSDFEKVKEKLLKEIKKDKEYNAKVRFLSVLKYAAIAIVFLGIGFVMKNNLLDNGAADIVVPREDSIVLELGNGEQQIIKESGSLKIVGTSGKVIGNKQDDQLIYEEQGNLIPEYNTLSIPNGKQFGIVLSDGTKVHLNAGSTLTYPTVFTDASRRVVLTGEAFFEVKHEKNRQFIVNVQNLDVKVYGTKFNVTDYYEDKQTEVVLVEGSVGLSSTESKRDVKEMFLEPGYMGVYNKYDKSLNNKKVNTALYTSWLKGNLVFRNVSFASIIQKLERHYNVVIINNNIDLANEKFNATIETKHETIEEVFSYFNKVYQIEYQIVENKIIIN
ncbi:FecR family protein [Maribacter ulvicola]|uniref:FecR family protein n=1 Tax=Maribacter ulvicola TaxID=228959 RepID=A0A1N6VGR9_9FLAO|nr:FecR family protein [Maribacter ulvicola]SIQ76939.1 FecR family protein [Maribacter ulvicola]